MKLVVQIPCLNEAETLPLVLKSIPKKIPGIKSIVILIIDDGSTDATVKVARAHGVKHFVFHPQTQGLGRSFHDGVQYALGLGADILVNTDGDNQYPQARITDLIRPIIKKQADIVVADRQTDTIEHFSAAKKLLQRVGSRVVSIAAGTKVKDAPSGFRAYSRDSLLRLNTISRFSYTMETIIQAGNKGLSIASVPVTTNPKLRESRLFKSTGEHVRKSAITIMRAYVMYKPYMVFGTLATVLFLISLIPFGRFIYLGLTDHSTRGHIQSLLVGSMFMIASFLCVTLNIIADLIRINRVLTEDNLEQTKRLRFK